MNTRGRFFTLQNKECLEEMLNMRRKGMSFVAIGRYYGKDHTTIMHHCKKYNVTPMSFRGSKVVFRRTIDFIEKPVQQGTVQSVVPPHKYAHLLEEPINAGKKSYKQYLTKKQIRATLIEL